MISVLGCGWLGFPLASRFVLAGRLVKGSTTQQAKNELLSRVGIEPYVVDLDQVDQALLEKFLASQVIVMTVPFKRGLSDPYLYVQQVKRVVASARSGPLKPWIILTSSTVVYPNDGMTWDESMFINPANERVAALIEAEKMVLGAHGTVVRLGGLYGPDRQIHHFFLKAQLLRSAQGVMNLIHQEDAVGVIEAIIREDRRGEIFNAVSDGHPTREELYTYLAQKHGVAMPVFDEAAKNALGKIVSNEKIKRVLKYQFIYPNPKDS